VLAAGDIKEWRERRRPNKVISLVGFFNQREQSSNMMMVSLIISANPGRWIGTFHK
jgi:hypothetical protein